jgi:hypothetical protein
MKRSTLLTVLSLISGLFCAGDGFAAARTFVSTANGNDANSCTASLPCRSFGAALLLTDPDGEIIALDSGGYGTVNITQPVSLISPTGVIAGITASAGVAINVSAGNSAHVVLRNLSISSHGGTRGISVTTAAAVYVEGCIISGFSQNGILFQGSTPGGRLYVSDSVIRRNDTGISVASALGNTVRAVIDAVSLLENPTGSTVVNAHMTIRNSVASGAVSAGFEASITSTVIIENSLATGNAVGFEAYGGGLMVLTRCTAAANYGMGIEGRQNNTAVYVSQSVITGNGTGVSTSLGGAVNSRANNTLQANGTDGTFTAPFLAH